MELGQKYGRCMCEMDEDFKDQMMKGGGSFWRSFVKGMKKGAQIALPVIGVTNPELAPAGEAALEGCLKQMRRRKKTKGGGVSDAEFKNI